MIPFLARARGDLDAIWTFVARDDIDAADRLIDRIVGVTARLADHPESGRRRPEIAPGARSIVVGRYLLLYRIGDNGAEIVRVLHGARSVAAALDEEGWD